MLELTHLKAEPKVSSTTFPLGGRLHGPRTRLPAHSEPGQERAARAKSCCMNESMVLGFTVDRLDTPVIKAVQCGAKSKSHESTNPISA